MDADDVLPNGGPPGNNRMKPNLTSEQRREVVRLLLLMVKDATNNLDLKRGSFSTVARHFGVAPTTVGNIWKRARLITGWAVGAILPLRLSQQTLLTPMSVIFPSFELCSPINGTMDMKLLLMG